LIGALTYLATFLGEHNDVREKLRAEILAKTATGAVSPSSLRDLPYLDAVCRESRRAQPILPITFFAKSNVAHEFEGVAIPAGIKAIGVIAGTLMDPDAFPEPTKFDPDRWLAPKVTERQHAGWVPHGGGAHLLGHRCAGEQLADLMLKMFAVLTLREFDWELPPQDLTPAKGRLFATPKDGLTVKLTRK
jgi:cytochrome P450